MREMFLEVLNVGQGLCSVVSGIKHDGEPYCGIFDCGTLAYNPKYNKDAVLARIRELSSLSGQKVITDIVISHQDIDHWSLLLDILTEYFGMDARGRLYRKNKFVCEITEGGTKLFTISTIMRVTAYFEGEFEDEKYIQKLYYRLTEREEVISFGCEGTFYEVNKRWDIKVYFFLNLFNRNAQPYIRSSLICTDNNETEIAKGEEVISSGILNIYGCRQAAKQALEDAKQNLLYDEQRFGRIDYLYMCGHITSMYNLMDSHTYTFSNIAKVVMSVPENEPVKPIQNIVWGGAEPSAKCRSMQRVMEIMETYGLINRFDDYPNGGYVKFQDDQLSFTNKMISEDYDAKMQDIHEETMQNLNIMRNATSVVTCMDFDNQVRFLFPGDITVHRFHLLVDAAGDETDYGLSIMTAPHHGSDVTNFCLQSDSEPQPLQSLLSLFRNDWRRIFLVSALSSKFGHPGTNFIQCALQNASDSEGHDICYGEEIVSKRAKKYECRILEVTKDVYCTEMTGDFVYHYPVDSAAVCAGRMQRTQVTQVIHKVPSKRLFI